MLCMGVAQQLCVSATEGFVPKKRLTHDFSFPGSYSIKSVNSIILKKKLEPWIFEHTLLRIIHKIVHLCHNYTDKIIWIQKEDAKSAYRRLHMNAETAILAGVQLQINGKDLLLIIIEVASLWIAMSTRISFILRYNYRFHKWSDGV